LVFGGFLLLCLGSGIDITDNFASLNRLVVVGDTPVEAFLEKVVGSLGGTLLLALGLVRWLPTTDGLQRQEQLLSELSLANERLVADEEKLQREISERRRAEDGMRRNEQMLRAITDSALDAIIVMDSAGKVTYWNPAAEKTFGYAVEEVMGCNVHELLAPPRYRQQAADGLAHFAGTGQGAAPGKTLELEALRKDGSEFPVGMSIAPVRLDDRWCAVSVMRDITERKRAERELQQYAAALESQRLAIEELYEAAEDANRAKSQFLANMSHEIRTPMTAILGFAEVPQEELECCCVCPEHEACEIRARNKNHVDTICSNGRHLLRLIDEILDLSKFEAGEMAVEREDCSPLRIVEEVASLTGIRARNKGLSLETKYEYPIPRTIHTDPMRLKQILLNLAGNAIKFTEQGSVEIRVRLARDAEAGPRMVFTVSDTGIGMTPAQTDRVFRPFTQADNSTTRRFGGTGLGLSISKRLAEMLGGDIEVESRPGAGSTFTLSVDPGPLDGVPMLDTPLASPGEAEKLVEAVPAKGLHGRVLLAEDGPDNQRLIGLILSKAGLDVDLAENGRIACQKAAASRSAGNPYDLILMDMQMPELDGYAATRQLRQHGWRGPIIALTAHAMAEDRQKCLRAGCDDYATKPIDRARLLSTVVRYLERVAGRIGTSG